MKFRIIGNAKTSVVTVCECMECGHMHDWRRNLIMPIDKEVDVGTKREALDFFQQYDEIEDRERDVVFMEWVEPPKIKPFRQEDFMRAAGEPELISIPPLSERDQLRALKKRRERFMQVKEQSNE